MTDTKPTTIETAELDKWIETAIRQAMIDGYNAGKKQLETPYEYTLDTDAGEKHFRLIKGFVNQLLQSSSLALLREVEGLVLKETNENPMEQSLFNILDKIETLIKKYK